MSKPISAVYSPESGRLIVVNDDGAVFALGRNHTWQELPPVPDTKRASAVSTGDDLRTVALPANAGDADALARLTNS